jgi:uncharacterized RmlC-like cupin family protein
MSDGFHPLRLVGGDQVTADTAQSGGMRRYAAISGRSVGSERIWMGRVHVAPETRSSDHHHGDSETAIYVVSGAPVFVFLGDDGDEVRLAAKPGDYVFVPPWTPHREENPDPAAEAVVVLARSTQEAIVVNLPSLRGPHPGVSGAGGAGQSAAGTPADGTPADGTPG